MSYKLASALRAKANKPYASRDVVVSIDATNIHALSGSEQPTTDGAEQVLAATNLGAALIFAQMFNLDEDPPVLQMNYQRIDSPHINSALARFLDAHYPSGEFTVDRLVMPLVP